MIKYFILAILVIAVMADCDSLPEDVGDNLHTRGKQ